MPAIRAHNRRILFIVLVIVTILTAADNNGRRLKRINTRYRCT